MVIAGYPIWLIIAAFTILLKSKKLVITKRRNKHNYYRDGINTWDSIQCSYYKVTGSWHLLLQLHLCPWTTNCDKVCLYSEFYIILKANYHLSMTHLSTLIWLIPNELGFSKRKRRSTNKYILAGGWKRRNWRRKMCAFYHFNILWRARWAKKIAQSAETWSDTGLWRHN